MREGKIDETAEFRNQLQALVGKPVGSGGTSVAPDPVNQPMIRHWAAAFEDRNPVYTDPDLAAHTRFAGIVAPPLMLQTWTMATPTITGIAERGGSPVESSGNGPLSVFDRAGFAGTLASNSEFEIARYLRLGEIISASTVVETISDQKHTRLGPGHFVTWATTYLDENGAVVGRQRFRILKFRPQDEHERTAHSPRDGHPVAVGPVMTASPMRRTLEWGAIHVGDRLPMLVIDVTATVIVAGAIATRDFMPVHHDRDYANAQGAPDIFMNILSDTAYCSRFLTDWTGPEAMVKSLAIRLGVPVSPGSTLTYTGRVIATSQVDNEGAVELEFRATTGLGDHVTGSAVLGLPIGQ